MNELDRNIINHMQTGFPVCERPFEIMAAQLQIPEDLLIKRIESMLADGTLSRFGPMFDAEKMGGIFSLVTMQVPPDDIDRVVSIINHFPEVAHNYERDHKFNIWFVVALDAKEKLLPLLKEIEDHTGYMTYNMPKLDEFYIGVKFDA
jgi:siroheme decarboxylase